MITINEVVTRDGFQLEGQWIPTDEKINLINRLSEAGFHKIEVTSFVSSVHVPQLKDAAEVMKGITRNPNVTYVALVPNLKGAQRALEADVDEVNVVISASATHNLANIRQTHEQSLAGLKEIVSLFKGTRVKVNTSIATTFGCPFEGTIQPEAVCNFIENYLAAGADSISLADTTGMAHPVQVEELSRKVLEMFPNVPFTLHFHNTRGMGMANILAGIQGGITQFDAAISGIGGCPFAPGATGNVCTEDVVHMLHAMGIKTGVDLDQILSISKTLPKLIGHETPGQIIKAGKITDLHPSPLKKAESY